MGGNVSRGIQGINWVWGYDVTPRIENHNESEMETRVRSGNATHPS